MTESHAENGTPLLDRDKSMKLVLLTSNRFGLASDCLAALCNSDRCPVIGVLLCRRAPGRWRALWRKLRKIGKIGMLGALIGLSMRRFYERHRTEEIEALCRRLGVAFFVSPSTNGAETAGLLSRLAPDLGLSLGSGYIAKRIFEIPKYGMINVHLERLPQYRNARSIIWPIYFLEEDTGFAIHKVDSRIDGGDILYQENCPIAFRRALGQTIADSLEALVARVPPAVRRVCDDYLRFAAAAQPQQNGSQFTTPTLRQFLRIIRNNRLLHQRTTAAARPVELARDIR